LARMSLQWKSLRRTQSRWCFSTWFWILLSRRCTRPPELACWFEVLTRALH